MGRSPCLRIAPMAGAALLVLMTIGGCAQKKPTSGQQEVIESSISETESVPAFPHPEGWEAAASHGVYAGRFGHQDCLRCHPLSSEQRETAPPCRSCHLLFPHPGGWSNAASHGTFALEKGSRVCATECHGTDFQGGLSGISCNACHAVFPHPDRWVEPAVHGETAKGGGKELCKGCHGDDLSGGKTGIGCASCHPLYPHPSEWGIRENHGSYVLQNGNTGCATQCHGTDLKGGLVKVACDSCHRLYPHPADWEEGHGTKILETGKAVCRNCHGPLFAKLLADKNCYSCHPDYPHPAAEAWIPYPGHGKRVREGYEGETDSCRECHGTDLDQVKAGKSCFTCHPSYPHQKVPGGDRWNEFEGHGIYTLQHTKME